MLETMYPAAVNSRQTELATAIDEGQTSFTVLDGSALPPAPNLFTIGTDESAETILYTSLSGNVVTGVRGFQGTARAWPSGSKLARYYTAYDHDAARGNILELAGRFDTPERSTITLQPGIHVVQAGRLAAFRLTGLQGRTVLNYQSQIGIFGVLNPYAIRYGENLLPPFYEWTVGTQKFDLNGPYEAIRTATAAGGGTSINLPVVAGQDYTLSYESSDVSGGYMNFRFLNAEGIGTGSWSPANALVQTMTAPNDATHVQVLVTGTVTGAFTFKNPMLNIGNTAKPFKPREDAILALQTELHANPDTGANPDMVFERDGQYFKLAKWRKVVLDGGLNWIYVGTNTGTKTVGVNALVDSGPDVYRKTVMTKYNGSLIKSGEISDLPAGDAGYVFGNSFRLSVKSADSGWGDSYSPTADEIKAYFMGWIMYLSGTGGSGKSGITPYNGTGTKYWARVASDGNTLADGTAVLPTTQALNFTPYQLLYQLATPVVEPITSEGKLTFFEGDNQIEVGTGLVVREGVKPAQGSNGDWGINIVSSSVNAPLKNKVAQMMRIYRNSLADSTWSIVTRTDGSAYGNQRASTSNATYGLSASYSVTYLMLDKYPAVDFAGTYAENEKALLLDTVRTLQENTTRISILESKKAEKDAPAWITPTLLNGWTTASGPGYKKIGNNVTVEIFITGGSLTQGSTIFKLPEKYRPASMRYKNVWARNTDASTIANGIVAITPSGDVQVSVGLSQNALVILSFGFEAEQ